MIGRHQHRRSRRKLVPHRRHQVLGKLTDKVLAPALATRRAMPAAAGWPLPRRTACAGFTLYFNAFACVRAASFHASGSIVGRYLRRPSVGANNPARPLSQAEARELTAPVRTTLTSPTDRCGTAQGRSDCR
jgi:hypothetical protein